MHGRLLPRTVRRMCVFAVALGALGMATAAAQEKTARPNALLMLADDMGHADYSFLGHEHIRMPRLDKLASWGARLPPRVSALQPLPAQTRLRHQRILRPAF